MRAAPLNPLQIGELVQMRLDGHRVQDIADQMGVSKATVEKHLQKHGIRNQQTAGSTGNR